MVNTRFYCRYLHCPLWSNNGLFVDIVTVRLVSTRWVSLCRHSTVVQYLLRWQCCHMSSRSIPRFVWHDGQCPIWSSFRLIDNTVFCRFRQALAILMIMSSAHIGLFLLGWFIYRNRSKSYLSVMTQRLLVRRPRSRTARLPYGQTINLRRG